MKTNDERAEHAANEAYDIAIEAARKLLAKLETRRAAAGKHWGDAGDAQHAAYKLFELIDPSGARRWNS